LGAAFLMEQGHRKILLGRLTDKKGGIRYSDAAFCSQDSGQSVAALGFRRGIPWPPKASLFEPFFI